MSRLTVPSLQSATGATAEIYSQIKKAVGSVPNTFAAIGAHGPAALKVLAADAVLASGTLTKRDQETIKLVISGVTGCDYCEAAHSLLGKLAGLKPDELKKIRDGQPTGDAKRDALVRFVRTLAETSGTVSDNDFAAIKAAGYTDAQLVDISLGGVRRRFSGDDRQYSFPHEGRRALGRLDLSAEAGRSSHRSAIRRSCRRTDSRRRAKVCRRCRTFHWPAHVLGTHHHQFQLSRGHFDRHDAASNGYQPLAERRP
jgi:uncharacterized peroxidase-related enzyme